MTGIRKTIAAVAALAFVAVSVGAPNAARGERGVEARGGAFGLGLMVGGPSGLSAKYYLDDKIALAAGLGVFYGYWAQGTQVHLDVLWHPQSLVETPYFSLPFYVGAGARFLSHSYSYRDPNNNFWIGESDTHMGARAPAGLVMNFKRIPLDVFLEAVLNIDIIKGGDCRDAFGNTFGCNHSLFSLYGALGARYYF